MSDGSFARRVVTWKDAAYGVAALMLILAGFAGFLLGEAKAEVDRHRREPMHEGTHSAVLRLESKIDQVLFLLLEEKNKAGSAYSPDQADRPR